MEVSPVVIDNGSHNIRAGFAAAGTIRGLFTPVVGRPHNAENPKIAFAGSHALAKGDKVALSYPIERGMVNNWDDMGKIWQYAFEEELKVEPEEYPVLLTEPPLNPKQNREKMAQIMFEIFNTPAVFIANQATLALYASGRTTGVILDSGDGVTRVVPIYEGQAIQHAIAQLDFGGRDLTDYLIKSVAPNHHDYLFNTREGRYAAVHMKETCCYVARNFKEENETATNTANLTKNYDLPNENAILLNHHRFNCTEAMFDPSRLGVEAPGIHELIHNAILKSDESIQNELFANIVLAGGNTLFNGFADRVSGELNVLAPTQKIKVIAPPERSISAWLGGSIVASLSTFQPCWISKEMYEESGPAILHHMSF